MKPENMKFYRNDCLWLNLLSFKKINNIIYNLFTDIHTSNNEFKGR